MAAKCSYCWVSLVLIGLAVGIRASPVSSSEREENYVQNLESFSKTNLTYECLRFTNYNQVPECDCLACANSRPDFLSKMCSFRATQDVTPPKRRSETNPEGDWHKICDSGAGCKRPTQCCDPAKGLQVENGCPKCIPTVDSTTAIGAHAACFVAERYASKRSEIGWKQVYQHYVDAVKQAKLSMKCFSYAVARTANPCDCEPCLQSEASTRVLREKLCELGRVVRSKSELNRRDFWGHNDYFLNFCDFDKCPEMPQKCCKAPNDAEATRLTYPVDSKGCPACLPTSSLYGFGPGCDPKLARFSQATRNRVMDILKDFPQES